MGLVGETHGTSSQCVSFSLIDAGSVLLSAWFFISFFLGWLLQRPAGVRL